MAAEGKYFAEGSMYRANSDLSTKQFCAVKFTNYIPPSNASYAGTYVDVASTGGEPIAGILMDTPRQYDAASVAFIGFPKAMAGVGGFSAGDKLVTESGTGRLITYAGSGAVVAVALVDAAAGCLGCVRLVPSTG